MLSLFILFLLTIGVLVGLRRGFILQTIHMFGFFIAFLLAVLFFRPLSDQLPMWIAYPQFDNSSPYTQLLFKSDIIETGFYHAIAFFSIFIVVKITLQIVASLFDFLATFPVLKKFNRLFGAVLGFLEFYMIILFVLTIAATVQIAMIQNAVQGSFVAKQMILKTPFLSSMLENMWFLN